MSFQYQEPKGANNEEDVVASYKILNLIRETTKYKIYSGIRLADNKSVFIKSVSKSIIIDDASQLQFQREVDALYYLQSPEIIEFLDFFTDKYHYYLVFEKLTLLHDYILNHRKLKEIEASSIFTAILKAVKLCHNNGIALRSLNLNNICISKKKDSHGKHHHIKLFAFESCSYVSLQSPKMDETELTCFTAPEQFSKTIPRIDTKSDIWSLGVILYMMLTGCQPWDSSNPVILKSNILKANFDIPYWISEPCREIIEGMIKVKPLHRLSIDDALHSTFIKCSCNNPTLQRLQQKQIQELSIKSNYMFFNSPLASDTLSDSKSNSSISVLSVSQNNNFQEIVDRPLPKERYDNDGCPMGIIRIIQSPWISPVPLSVPQVRPKISSRFDPKTKSCLSFSAKPCIKGMHSSFDVQTAGKNLNVLSTQKRTGSTSNEPIKPTTNARPRPTLPNIRNRQKISHSIGILSQKPLY